MINKIRKYYFYLKACHKGEIFKRIEYKLKDKVGYFEHRTKRTEKEQNIKLYDIKINNEIKQMKNTNDSYTIFQDTFLYQEIEKRLYSTNIFWRKEKLNQYNDIKNIWEYNRLQFLLPIAIQYLQTNDIKYKERIVEILKYWENNNKFEYSINWNNNLEVAIRGINIALTLLLINDKNIQQQFSKLIYLHALHIFQEINYSDCCIPNNHVIGEATALLFLSNIIDTKKNKKWKNKAIYILKKHINIIDEYGFSKENSFSYQFFVTKMFLFNLCFIKEEKFYKELFDKILKSIYNLNYIIINNNKLFNYGDNDGAYLYSLQNEYNIEQDIKQYYNFLFQEKNTQEIEIYKELLRTFNPNMKIIKGKEKEKKYILTDKIFVYKWSNNLLFFNVKPIEGHAHNDSLAINLILNGQEILIDSGTYSYNSSKEKRIYYRGREAHNTIQIYKDKNVQQIGSFRWINKNNTKLELLEDNEEVIKIKGTICEICERTISIHKNKNIIDIQDINFKEKTIKQHWITANGKIINNNLLKINIAKFEFDYDVTIEEQTVNISKKYLQEEPAKLYSVINKSNTITLKIVW